MHISKISKNKTNITIVKTEAEFDRIAAWRIIQEILIKPTAVIGLATGKTTGNVHRLIAAIHQFAPFEVSDATFFNLDEVTNVDRDYAGACYAMIRNELLDALKLPDSNFVMPPTRSDDFEAACREFENELLNRGGVDLQVLGLGLNGHLGFNQPGTPFERRTWLSEMDEALEARIRRETQTPADIHLGGITLGLRNIMEARKVLLLAKGKSKAEIVAQMLQGSISTDVPASILQLHANCEFLLDEEAASLLNLD